MIIDFLTLLLPILICVAFSTLFERKVLAAIQLRRGPNVVFWVGLFQPFADALKAIFKEAILPLSSNPGLFVAGPALFLSLALINWTFLYVQTLALTLDYNIFLLLLCSALSVYGILLAGWASNSSYSFLGSVRSVAQLISYEISFALIFMSMICNWSSTNMINSVYEQTYLYNIVLFFPLFILFFVTVIAETCRPPFDLPEAEAELVSGYNVEYSSLPFAFFFIAEYANMLVMSFLTVNLFLGGHVYHWLLNLARETLHNYADEPLYVLEQNSFILSLAIFGLKLVTYLFSSLLLNADFDWGMSEIMFMYYFPDATYFITMLLFFACLVHVPTYFIVNRAHLFYEEKNIYAKYLSPSFFSIITPIFFGYFSIVLFILVHTNDHIRVGTTLDTINNNFPFNLNYEDLVSLVYNSLDVINLLFPAGVIAAFLYQHYFFLNTLIYSFKVLLIFLLFVWIRGAVPRYRYDQLMTLQWRKFLPLSVSLLILYASGFSLYSKL